MSHSHDASIDLTEFFQPKSVAVIGASRNPQALGGRIIASLLAGGFTGSIYPVNPRAEKIGELDAYPSASALPTPADLAVICVPREAVLAVIDDCIAAGIRAAVVITSGFAELDDAGRDLQQQLVDKAAAAGLRLIGPNCVGLLNADPDVCLSVTISSVTPPRGPIALCSHSGALGVLMLASAERFGIGFSKFVSIGNEADLSVCDLLVYWGADDYTGVILLYLESLRDARRLAEVARTVSRTKPILALKAGRTEAGQSAAGSHTAALIADEMAVDALFERSGMTRVESLDEMLDLAALLSNQPLPGGGRVGILTNAGGPAVLCADACATNGLEVPTFSQTTRDALAEFIPPPASLSNPVDVTAAAGPEQYARATQCLLNADDIDALVVIYVPVEMMAQQAFIDAIVDSVGQARSDSQQNKPVIACVITQQGERVELSSVRERIPCCVSPAATARALSQAVRISSRRDKPLTVAAEFTDMNLPQAQQICADAIASRGDCWLTAREKHELLAALNLPQAAEEIADSADQAVAAAASHGFPVVLKAASSRIVHKTDVGTVRLGLSDEAAVQQAYEEIVARLSEIDPAAAADGVLVQPMLTGTEVIVGARRDEAFGPLVLFGMGGIQAEVLGDVCCRMTPLSTADADEMIRSIQGYQLLCGYRGAPPVDMDAIANVLLRTSQLIDFVPQIGELDLNPILVQPEGEGCWIVDCRIRVESVK